MSLLKTYTNLSPKAKLAFGVGLVSWGFLGLTFGDKIESKLGFTPTEADKAELDKIAPKIHVVERKS
ncbi:hypothetical protein C7999DRAFT_43411 [Corynascus novoguineensis]|uniref:Uncharacterized protein n=1 Tax=Corynascus novoguineensis TaxID=1126955 RepID=A0AAN7CMR4_9PEZI|nr:hypothetical protein C7999DRAFT_43411 [Corynascus novoguineensis]